MRPSRWGCFFSGDLKLYRCVYCGCPTGSCRPNRKKRAGNARPYVIDFCSDYAVGATIGRPSCRFCRKRPLSRLRRQLPFRRGAMGGGNVIGCDCLPCARGGGSDACGRAGGVVFFSGDLKLYRCVYCGCPTGSCRPNRKKRAGNARPYVIDFCSDYAVGATIGRPSCRFCRKRPLSRLRRQLPLRRGAKGNITAAQNAIS